MLQGNVIRPAKAHRRQLTSAPAKGGEIFYVGAFVAYDLQGFVRPATDDFALAMPAGVVVEAKFPDDPAAIHAHLDNRNGSDGSIVGDKYERAVTFDTGGHYFVSNILGTPRTGEPAWIVDDDTVTTSENSSGLYIGTFLHPGVDQFRRSGWFIDICRMGRRLRDSRTADLAVLAGTDPVERGDVVELDTPAGALTVKKGAGSGSTAFVGVALHSASPGETIQVFRSGLLDFVKVKDGVALPAGVLLGWEGNTVRVFDSVNDFAVIGRALDASPGGTDQVVQAEIWFPPNLKI